MLGCHSSSVWHGNRRGTSAIVALPRQTRIPAYRRSSRAIETFEIVFEVDAVIIESPCKPLVPSCGLEVHRPQVHSLPQGHSLVRRRVAKWSTGCRSVEPLITSPVARSSSQTSQTGSARLSNQASAIPELWMPRVEAKFFALRQQPRVNWQRQWCFACAQCWSAWCPDWSNLPKPVHSNGFGQFGWRHGMNNPLQIRDPLCFSTYLAGSRVSWLAATRTSTVANEESFRLLE